MYEGTGGGYFGNDDCDDWDEVDQSTSVGNWYTEDGHNFASGKRVNVDLEQSLISPTGAELEEIWQEGDCDSDEEGYTGNAGPSKTETYERYILVFWPAVKELNMFFDYDSNRDGATLLKDIVMAYKGGKTTRETVVDYCQRVFEKWKQPPLVGSGQFNYQEKEASLVAFSALMLFEDVGFLRTFLQNVLVNVGIGDTHIGAKLVAFIRVYGWDREEFKESLLQIVDTSLNSNLSECLHFLLKLNHEGLDNTPVRAKIVTRLMQEIKSLSQSEKVTLCVLLVELKDSDNLQLLTEYLCNVLTDLSTLKQFVSLLKSNINFERIRLTPLRALVEKLISMLQEIVNKGPPLFTWQMSQATMPTHIDVQQFLRGPQQSYIVRELNGISHARNFANKYGGHKTHYSATMIPGTGTGKHATVHITKTRDYYNASLALFESNKREMIELQAQLNGETIATSAQAGDKRKRAVDEVNIAKKAKPDDVIVID